MLDGFFFPTEVDEVGPVNRQPHVVFLGVRSKSLRILPLHLRLGSPANRLVLEGVEPLVMEASRKFNDWKLQIPKRWRNPSRTKPWTVSHPVITILITRK